MKTSLPFLFLLLWLNAGYGADLPPDFVARYEIKKGFIKIGEAQRSLSSKDGKLRYISDSRTTGVIARLFPEDIIQTTEFVFDNQLIKPIHYSYNRNNGEKTVEQDYIWKKKQVKSQRGNDLFEYSIPDKVQDQSIYQLSLMLDLADGLRNFTYHIAENVRLVDYQVKNQGQQSIDTPLGKINTIKVQVKNNRIETTIWCAEKYHFLPVKIKHEENGTSFTAWLTQVKGL